MATPETVVSMFARTCERASERVRGWSSARVMSSSEIRNRVRIRRVCRVRSVRGKRATGGGRKGLARSARVAREGKRTREDSIAGRKSSNAELARKVLGRRSFYPVAGTFSRSQAGSYIMPGCAVQPCALFFPSLFLSPSRCPLLPLIFY